MALRIEEADAVIEKTAQENDACRRLVAIPGIGPVTATALIADEKFVDANIVQTCYKVDRTLMI